VDDSGLTEAERRFLSALERRGVRFLVVGMSAALLQGARGATEDIDLWFGDPSDAEIGAAAREVGAIYLSGSFGIGALGDRIDVVTHMHGLGSFDEEASRAVRATIECDLELPLLPLERILVSKRATGRAKDAAQIPALEVALTVLREPADD
jgi:hypothetical protein